MLEKLIYALLSTGITSAVSEITLESILKWYGALCLFTLPVSLLVMLYIYKKRPGIVKKFDETIDRLIDGKAKGKEPEPETETEKKNETTEKVPTQKKPTIEEDNIESGIPNMVLQVGDKYKCCLSAHNRNIIRGGNYTWGTDNPFVGSIVSYNGTFEAKKVGKTYIHCGGENIKIYYADIKPNNTSWFGFRPINDVLSKLCLANIEVRELTSKIEDISNDKDILTYDYGTYKLSYKTNKKNEVIQIMFRLPDRKEILDEVKKEITEYMEPLKLKEEQQDKFYWYHMCGAMDEDYPNSVDFTAFLRKSKKGDWYLGIGEYWRFGASSNEVAENTEMVERSFKELMDKEDVPAIIGTGIKKESRAVSSSDSNKETHKASPKKKKQPKPSPEQEKNNTETNNDSDSSDNESDKAEPETSERPVTPMDDPTDVPESNPSAGEDIVDEESTIELDSADQDPFATLSGESEENIKGDINHNEK